MIIGIRNIKTSAKESIPQKILKGTNEIGSHAINMAVSIKDKFTKTNTAPKEVEKIKIGKETVIGAILIAAALKIGIKLIKSTRKKIKETKQEIN